MARMPGWIGAARSWGLVAPATSATRIASLAVALLALCAPILRAQSRFVSGHVTDSTGRPVPLAYVYASDRAGNLIGRGATLTDATGRYLLSLSAGDTGYVAVRRIGFRPPPPRRLPAATGDIITIDLVVGAIPHPLAPVRVTPGVCRPIAEFDAAHPVRELWNGAVEAIHARQTFLDLYGYDEHVVREETQQTRPSRVTMDTANHVTPPQPDLDPAFRSDPLGKIWVDQQRRRNTSLWAPTDRALIDSAFVSRFCFEDGIVQEAGNYTRINFREISQGRGGVLASGTLRFRSDVPGLAAVVFTYEAGGIVIGRASVSFSMVPVEGTEFPLETSAFLEIAEGTRVSSRATTSHSYSNFVRVAR